MTASTTYRDATVARCDQCGGTFHRKATETWKRRCIECWKQSLVDDAWERGFEAGETSARSQAPAAVEGLDKARMRALLQLCHPDKHAGSELATATTAWLLTIKARLK